MSENETTIIIQNLTERTIGSAQSLALKDALTADLPKSIKLYLQCEVMRWLQNDLKNESHFSNIPSSAQVVHQLTKLYTRTLAPEYIFARQEFMNTLDNAVHFVENYLCRPQWTLAQFMFEKSERATLADVQARFEYTSDYLYYSKLVLGSMRQQGMQDISAGEFRTLLARIDDQVVQQHNPRELALLTRPIFEHLLMQSGIEGKAIPIQPLVIFFDDKRMIALKEYIERICRIRNTDRLTIEQLAEIIEDQHGGSASRSEAGQQRSSEPDIQPGISTARQEEAIAATSQQDLDLEPPPAQTSSEQVEDAAQPVAPAGGADRRNIALSLTFSGMTTPRSPSIASLPDLRNAITDDQRERFIKTIFQKDESYFAVVIETLNSMRTWNDASLYLQSFYHTSGVDPFHRDVVEFTDLIQHRYST